MHRSTPRKRRLQLPRERCAAPCCRRTLSGAAARAGGRPRPAWQPHLRHLSIRESYDTLSRRRDLSRHERRRKARYVARTEYDASLHLLPSSGRTTREAIQTISNSSPSGHGTNGRRCRIDRGARHCRFSPDLLDDGFDRIRQRIKGQLPIQMTPAQNTKSSTRTSIPSSARYRHDALGFVMHEIMWP